MGAIIQDRIARTLEKFEREQDTLDEIAQRMGGAMAGADGEPVYQGLPEICREWDVPYGRVLSWLMASEERYSVYQRCLEVQAHLLVGETVAIADTDPGATEKGGTDTGAVAHAKLRIETRFRVAKHHASKVYGDKAEHTGVATPVFNVTIHAGNAGTQPAQAVTIEADSGSVL